MPTAPPFQPPTTGSVSRPVVGKEFLLMAASDLHQAGMLAEAPKVEQRLPTEIESEVEET